MFGFQRKAVPISIFYLSSILKMNKFEFRFFLTDIFYCLGHVCVKPFSNLVVFSHQKSFEAMEKNSYKIYLFLQKRQPKTCGNKK